MKKIIFLFFGIALLASCSKKENHASIIICQQEPKTYSDTDSTFLSLTDETWYLTRNNHDGGDVRLQLSGSTNGDSVFIRTYGDGLVSDYKVNLDSLKKFNSDVEISFTYSSLPEGNFTSGTIVNVYRATNIFSVELKSCTLCY
jgi:hypothetical protein